MSDNDFERVMGSWEAVVADMETTAAEYREAEWEVLELHPGDVTVLNDQHGLSVLVPGNEFEELEALAAEATFESYEVYRAEESGMIFALVVLEDSVGERAVCYLIHYERAEIEELREHIAEAGVLCTYIRPLSDARTVTFRYEDPTLFF